MNIAFVSNFQKTYLFSSIASRLEEKGYVVYWFCFQKNYYNYLCESYLQDRILLLNRTIVHTENVSVGEYKLNELVYSDRALTYEKQFGIDYLTKIQQPISTFITDNHIRCIFGEMTYAHEILINRICRDKFEGKCEYLHPQSIRIPNGRFTFMDTEFQNSFHKACLYINMDDIAKFDIPLKATRPQRVAEVDVEVKKSMSLASRLSRVKRMFTEENIEKDSPSLVINRWQRYRKAIVEEKNKYMYNRWERLTLKDIKGKNFFLYTLHMQPEASVDVVGRYYENQLQIIKNIWRIMPSDYILLIKEHSNAIGNRGYNFYRECIKYPHVYFINEYTDSHALIDECRAIFTNSGTIGLEAALKGKPAFVFSRIFYDKLSGVYNISIEDLKFSRNYYSLLKIKEMGNEEKMTVKEYSEYIISSSFWGVVDPPVSSPLFTDNTNINLLANSFDTFLKHVQD